MYKSKFKLKKNTLDKKIKNNKINKWTETIK